MKRVMVMVMVGAALILQGCAEMKHSKIETGRANGGWKELEEVKITKGEKPYETSQKSEALPTETEVKKKAEYIPEKREIVYDQRMIPNIILSEYLPLKPTQRRNVAQIRQRAAQTGLEAHFINKLHLVRNRAPNGKWVIQRAQNVLYLGHWTQERSTGKKIFTPVEIAECGNEADGFKEVVTPAKILVTTTYRDREIVTVVERYRDTVVIKKIVPQPRVEERINPLDYNYDGGVGGVGGSCGGGGPGGR